MIEAGAEVMGFIAIKSKAPILAELFLPPKHLGVGVSKALYQERPRCITALRQLGCHRIRARDTSTNVKASCLG